MPREHGTVRGYRQHLRYDTTKPCDDCRAAWTESRLGSYSRQHPDARARELGRQNAKNRALARLRARYPRDYRVLLDEELTREDDQ